MQYLLKKPRTKVQEERKWGVEFPGDRKVKAAMERHPAMVHESLTHGCLPYQYCVAKNLQTHWRRNGMDVTPLDRHSHPTPEPKPPLPRTPLAPPTDTEGARSPYINNVPLWYAYAHASLPNPQFFNLDAYAMDSKHDTDFHPHWQMDEGTSTG